MSELFYKKGNDLLQKLKIQTNSVSNNKDIQVSKNFSAVLPTKATKNYCELNGGNKVSNSYKKEEIETAINLLRENGYVVKKLTVGQLEDAKECEDCGFEGDCAFCRCSICIIQ